jgi:hypothetical protein
MEPDPREEVRQALETTERVLEALRNEPEPDDFLRMLMRQVEDQRAALLASLIEAGALDRAPRRISEG